MQVCRDRIWKGKNPLVLKLVRDTKVNMKGFYIQSGSKNKTRENTGNCTRGMKKPRYSMPSFHPSLLDENHRSLKLLKKSGARKT